MSTKKPIDDGMDEVKLSGEYKLEQRVSRLKRLIELGAPPIVIANEVILVQKAMWLFDPKSMAAALEDSNVRVARRDAGFCETPGCQNYRDSENRQEYCKSCLAHHEEINRQEEMEDAVEESKGAEKH